MLGQPVPAQLKHTASAVTLGGRARLSCNTSERQAALGACRRLDRSSNVQVGREVGGRHIQIGMSWCIKRCRCMPRRGITAQMKRYLFCLGPCRLYMPPEGKVGRAVTLRFLSGCIRGLVSILAKLSYRSVCPSLPLCQSNRCIGEKAPCT